MKLLDELRKTRASNNSSDIIKKTHYNNLVARIKFVNSYGKRALIYTIPIFLPSLPLYDIDTIRNYLSVKLKNQGFKVNKVDTNDMHITW